MPVLTIPVINQALRRPTGSSTKDQLWRNVLFDVVENAVSGKTAVYARQRPALSLYQIGGTPWTGIPNGVIWVPSNDSSTTPDLIYATNNSSNWELYKYDGASTHTQLGSGTLAATHEVNFINETKISGTGKVTYVSTGGNAAYFSELDGTTFTKITDADFPANASRTITGPMAHHRGFASIMDTTGRVYSSDINSLSSWTANSYFTANTEPSGGVGVWVHNDYLACFKNSSIEFARNAGNPTGSPYSLIPGSATKFGVASAEHVTPFQDTLAFIGNHAPASGVYLLNELQPQKISTDEIDREIYNDQFAGFLANARLVGVNMAGEACLLLYLQNGNTWLFQSSVGIWSAISGYPQFIRRTSRSASGQMFAGVFNTQLSYGGYGQFREDIYQDALVNPQGAANISWLGQIGPITFGTNNRVTLDYIRVIGDRADSTRLVTVQYAWDDSGSYSTARTVDISSPFTALYCCGSGRRVTLNITRGTANVPYRIHAIELGYTPGTV